MLEQLKKNMFIGIGLMAMTRTRIMEFGKKLAEDSKLSEDEGKKLVDDLLTQADDMKKYFEKRYGRARIFECEIGIILYQNLYRTKTDKIKLIKEII